jgi:2-oxoglutarate ferredoxin oxidoreductase subunit gamma
MSDIICAGFGGQGVLTAGLILARIAMAAGREVTWIPSYGSEMRGGTANCSVRISNRPIASPFIKEIDLLYALNEMSADKFEPGIRPGGVMVVNSSLIDEGRIFRGDIKVKLVPAGDMAEELTYPRGLNLIMLAAGVAAAGLLDKATFAAGVHDFFAAKGKNHPLNAECTERGWLAGLGA